jgi:hypothetical protein
MSLTSYRAAPPRANKSKARAPALASKPLCSNSKTGLKGENVTNATIPGTISCRAGQSMPCVVLWSFTSRSLGLVLVPDVDLPGDLEPAVACCAWPFLMDIARPNSRSSAVSARWAWSSLSSSEACISINSDMIALALKLGPGEPVETMSISVAVSLVISLPCPEFLCFSQRKACMPDNRVLWQLSHWLINRVVFGFVWGVFWDAKTALTFWCLGGFANDIKKGVCTCSFCLNSLCILQAWQRPTLPCLKTKYHWRRGG